MSDGDITGADVAKIRELLTHEEESFQQQGLELAKALGDWAPVLEGCGIDASGQITVSFGELNSAIFHLLLTAPGTDHAPISCLDLGENEALNDESLALIAELPNLSELNLFGCTGISCAAVEAFKENSEGCDLPTQSVTLDFPSSFSSSWEFWSEDETREFFREVGSEDEDFDWDQPVSDIADELEAEGQSMRELAEDVCGNNVDEVAGATLYGFSVSGPTVGSLSDATQTVGEGENMERGEKEIHVYWDESDAFRYSAEVEVDHVFDFHKLEIYLTPSFEGSDVVDEILYDGDGVDLEEDEQGSMTENRGFDFPD